MKKESARKRDFSESERELGNEQTKIEKLRTEGDYEKEREMKEITSEKRKYNFRNTYIMHHGAVTANRGGQYLGWRTPSVRGYARAHAHSPHSNISLSIYFPAYHHSIYHFIMQWTYGMKRQFLRK